MAISKDEARERARVMINRFMSTKKNESDYSCKECELTAYLCPHLFERLQEMIAEALVAA